MFAEWQFKIQNSKLLIALPHSFCSCNILFTLIAQAAQFCARIECAEVGLGIDLAKQTCLDAEDRFKDGFEICTTGYTGPVIDIWLVRRRFACAATGLGRY